MNLKISVDRSSTYRAQRKPLRDPRGLAVAREPSPCHSPVKGNWEDFSDSPKRQLVRRVAPTRINEEAVAPRPGFLSRAFSSLFRGSSQQKQLWVAETAPLGDKRFVAIVHAEGRRFLIGGGTSSVSVLARLDEDWQGEDDRESLEGLRELAG